LDTWQVSARVMEALQAMSLLLLKLVQVFVLLLLKALIPSVDAGHQTLALSKAIAPCSVPGYLVSSIR